MNAQVIRILVNIQIIKITGKINSTPVASKSPSDFDTEVKAISADNALLFVFFAGIMIFFGGLAGRFAVVSNQKINAQIHFGMIAFGGGIYWSPLRWFCRRRYFII